MSAGTKTAQAAQLQTQSPNRTDVRLARTLLALLPMLAASVPALAAGQSDFDWKRCAVEVMPASARALVAAQQSLIDGNGFTPDHHDTQKKLQLACGYEIRRRTGEEPRYFRPRVLYRHLKRNMSQLVGEDRIEPSFVLFQLLDPSTSPPTFMGHRTYVYLDNVLVDVVQHASTTCWVDRDLKVNEFTGREIEHLQQTWPKESLDKIVNDTGVQLTDEERAQIFPLPLCELQTRAHRGDKK